MNVVKLINKFINYIENEMGYSSHTVRAYKADINNFFDIIDVKDCFYVTKYDIQSFIQDDRNRSLSSSTILRKISTIKSFFNYCEKFHNLKNNPSYKIVVPKIGKSLPNILTRKEINNLFLLKFESDIFGLRDKLIIEILYSTGIRLSELTKIKLSEIDLKNSTIHIRNAKRNSDRIIIMGKYLFDTILCYIKEVDMLSMMSSNLFLFPALRKSSSGHISDKFVYNVIKKYLKKVSNNDKLSTHSLRHTFATHLLQNGADIMAVKDLLGHKSLSSTQIYTHLKFKELRKIYNQSHPHAK